MSLKKEDLTFTPLSVIEESKLDKEEKRELAATRKAEFEEVTRPVIAWLNANAHPHVTVIIDPTSAVLYEGDIAYTTQDYLRD